ncbi:MAG: hypothetical protein OSA97_16015, partial [Nevskia sp.]|nr:hypothetical protein [Nevskia sp.]
MSLSAYSRNEYKYRGGFPFGRLSVGAELLVWPVSDQHVPGLVRDAKRRFHILDYGLWRDAASPEERGFAIEINKALPSEYRRLTDNRLEFALAIRRAHE